MLKNIISEEFILPIFGLKSSGVSVTNDTIDNEFKGVSVHLEETEPYWYKLNTIGQYCDEIHEYFNPNWDGYGALPISKVSFIEALKFYFSLPTYAPVPELVPLPSGEVGFEWYKNNNKQFNITFTDDSSIIYAGIYGPLDKKHGTCLFDGTISNDIMRNINKVYK